MGGPPGETARQGPEGPRHGGPVGFLGGTFDPPHLGHVELARTVLDVMGLERLIVMVVGEAPHKPVKTDAETRLALARAAFAGLPRTEVSRHELDRPGPSYTVETARWAAEHYPDPIWIVGGDELADFPMWRDPEDVLRHVRLAVAARPGHDRADLERVRERLSRPERVTFFDLRPLPIASREIRARVASGAPVDDVVPAPVAALIAERGLYRS